MQRVTIGFAVPSLEALSEDFTLDRYLIPHPLNTLLVEMTDTAMHGTIEAGDLLIVERNHFAKVGQIVLALLNNQYYVRFLGKDGKGYFLYGTQSDPRPPLRGQLEIVGRVTGLVRKFG